MLTEHYSLSPPGTGMPSLGLSYQQWACPGRRICEACWRWKVGAGAEVCCKRIFVIRHCKIKDIKHNQINLNFRGRVVHLKIRGWVVHLAHEDVRLAPYDSPPTTKFFFVTSRANTFTTIVTFINWNHVKKALVTIQCISTMITTYSLTWYTILVTWNITLGFTKNKFLT